MTKVVIGMSGGVDSSVAAHLLIKQGYEVTGLFMKNWEEDDGTQYCSAAKDLEDAQNVADKLNINLISVNFATEYWDNVFSHFLSEFKENRTPNPDILCNSEIKFKCFLEYAKSIGADKIATGHYAGLKLDEDKLSLIRGLDQNKDQSYFLHALSKEQLKDVIFPLQELKKSEVRAIANELGLANKDKKDSTGICFIGERKFSEFLETYLPAQPGIIKTIDNHIIGKHNGLMYYTIGQRKGLNIGGVASGNDNPWYVVSKDQKNNELIVAQGHDHIALQKNRLSATKLSFINIPKNSNFQCTAKIRYRQQDQKCRVNLESGKANVEFDTPQRAVTPGQYIVFYNNDECLGGGVIIE